MEKKAQPNPISCFLEHEKLQEFCCCPQTAEGMLQGGHIPWDGLSAGCWRHSWFLMLLKVWEAAFLTKILLAARPGAEGLSEGREGIVFLQLAQPGECREL